MKNKFVFYSHNLPHAVIPERCRAQALLGLQGTYPGSMKRLYDGSRINHSRKRSLIFRDDSEEEP